MSINRHTPVCPVCGNPAQPETKPFCGRGCRDRDLLKWLGEDYRVPGPAIDPGQDDFRQNDDD